MQIHEFSSQWIQKRRNDSDLSVLLLYFAEIIKGNNHWIIVFTQAVDDDLLVARFPLQEECQKVFDQNVIEFEVELRVGEFLLAYSRIEKEQVRVVYLFYVGYIYLEWKVLRDVPN